MPIAVEGPYRFDRAFKVSVINVPFLSNSVTQVFTIRTELSVGRIRRSAPPIHLAILRSIASIIFLAVTEFD